MPRSHHRAPAGVASALLSLLAAAAAATPAAAADPLATLSLVPWPQQVTLADGGGATLLSNASVVFFSPAAAQPAAEALAQDLLSVFGLGVATRPAAAADEEAGAPLTAAMGPGAGNILLALGAVPLPPPPPPLPPPPPGAACNGTAVYPNTAYNNSDFADPNGPRTTADAGGCCALCSQTANCNFWSVFARRSHARCPPPVPTHPFSPPPGRRSFQIDPAVPGNQCRWATLTYCCWLHSSDANATADSRYTSGAAPGLPPLPPTGAVPPTTAAGFEDASYSLTARAASGAVAVGASVSALHHAAVTLLQSLLPPPALAGAGRPRAGVPAAAAAKAAVAAVSAAAAASGAAALPAVDVLDWPLRPWRGLQLDLSSGYYHSIDELKRAIDLCRMVKSSVLVLHTGAETWMGLAMQSVENMNATWRHSNPAGGCYGGCLFYAGSEMRDLVAYGLARGVRLVPHCEATPAFPYNVEALTTRFNPNSTAADFVDEIDGLGPSGFNGTTNPRFWNAMRYMLNASVSIFGAAWPGGTLPVLHVGAVLGEGGMDDDTAFSFYSILRELQPGIAMAFYDGPCASCNDSATHPLYAVRNNTLVQWYTDDYSESPLRDYVANAWPMVSITWLPLYVLGGSGPYSPEETFAYNILVSNNQSFFSGSALDSLTRGAMLSTWTMKTPDDLSYARQRLPAMAEKAWQYRGAPVPSAGPESFAAWHARWANVDAALDAVMGATPLMYECTADLDCVGNPNGNGSSYQEDCGVCGELLWNKFPPPTHP